MPLRVVVGSASRRKLEVAEQIWTRYFPDAAIEVTGFNIPSGQPDTPYDRQTFDGATARAKGAAERTINFDYAVGLESGLIERYGHLFEEAWVCILGAARQQALGYSSGLLVPHYIQQRMKSSGREHSEEMTLIEQEFGLNNSDTWGTYTGGQLLRQVSLEEACRNALLQLLPFQNSFYHLELE